MSLRQKHVAVVLQLFVYLFFFFLHHQKYILFMTWNPHKTLFLVFFPLSDYWQPHETYFWVRSKALVSSLRDDRNHFWNKSTYSVVSVCGKFSLRRLRREQLQCRCWCLTSDTEVLQLPEVGAKRTFPAVCAQSQQLCFDFCHSSSCNRVHWLFSCIVHTKTSFLIHCDIDMSTQWAFLKIDKPHINFMFFFLMSLSQFTQDRFHLSEDLLRSKWKLHNLRFSQK